MFICKDCGRELRKDDVCCPGCGSTGKVMNNYVAEPFTFKTAFKSLFMNFNKFNGRSGREEFWKAFVGNIIATFLFLLLIAIVGLVVYYPTFRNLTSREHVMNEMDIISIVFAVLCAIAAIAYCVIITIGWISMFTRRMHDIGKPGVLAFLYFVPVVGSIILLVLSIADSEPEINNYGTNPKVKLNA